ncbi:MAG TPA: hypothetical protein VGN42_06575, partial [Pirellulales bacterium]|nr:hypothetical protein [Pirellulales bacterium]
EFFDKDDSERVASKNAALQNVAPQNVNAQFVAAEDGVIADRIRLTPSDPVGSVGVVLRLAD